MVMMLATGKSVEIVKVTVTKAVFNVSGTWSAAATAANVNEGVTGPVVAVITPPVAGVLSAVGAADGLSDEVAMLNFPAF